MASPRSSTGRPATVSDELFPLKARPRPNLPSARRTFRPTAIPRWPDRSAKRMPVTAGSLKL